jgi:hypothetical protein
MTAPVFAIYTEGLCFASVCTSLTDEQATARMPEAGGDLVWRIFDGPFHDGIPNGSPCPDDPDTHRHLLFEC